MCTYFGLELKWIMESTFLHFAWKNEGRKVCNSISNTIFEYDRFESQLRSNYREFFKEQQIESTRKYPYNSHWLKCFIIHCNRSSFIIVRFSLYADFCLQTFYLISNRYLLKVSQLVTLENVENKLSGVTLPSKYKVKPYVFQVIVSR